MINSLLDEAVNLLKKQPWEWAICGGMGIDLFLGYESRRHGDIDILAYWKDRDDIIRSMWAEGYQVYEMLGGGKVHHITDIQEQRYEKRNIFAMLEGCELVHLTPTGEKDVYDNHFSHEGLKKLNYVEFLFNDRDEDWFYYARNKAVRRELSKAILYCDAQGVRIPYLAPELLCLYKSTDTDREGYGQDFELAYAQMNQEQRDWLREALLTMNPEGHKWIDKGRQKA